MVPMHRHRRPRVHEPYRDVSSRSKEMKKLLQLGCLALLLVVAAPALAQQPQVQCSAKRGGERCGFAPRVVQALEKLDLACKRWTIIILDDEEWNAMAAARVRAGQIPHTERAFTLLSARRTYLREAYFAGRPEPILIEVLAHEFAHLRICGASESCAKEIAARIAALQDFSSANPQPDAWLRVRHAQDRARAAFEALR